MKANNEGNTIMGRVIQQDHNGDRSALRQQLDTYFKRER